MANIFISYSSKDRDLAKALADDLESLGAQVWFDRELTRTGGQKWWANILTKIRGCDLFIFALTPQALASDPCQREYRYAYALNKQILPVMLANVDIATIPSELQEIQFVDYRKRSTSQALALAGSLANLPVMRSMPDPLPPEPSTPLSPLAHLSQKIDTSTLSSSEQIELVFELEAFYNAPETRAGAEVLLRKIYERPDITLRVGNKIRSLIPDFRRTRPLLPIRGLVIAIMVFLVVGTAGLILRQFGAFAAGTPTPTQSTQVAIEATASNTASATLTPIATFTRTSTATFTDTPNPPTKTATITATATFTDTPNPPTKTLTVIPPSNTPQPTQTSASLRVIASVTPTFFPTQTRAQLNISQEDFQHGFMFWIQAKKVLWVLYTAANNRNAGTWETYPDTFVDGEQESDPSVVPPPGLFQPTRGFGKVWRMLGLKDKLGWATTPEYALTTTYVYQPVGSLDANQQYVSQPGTHYLTSLNRDVFALSQSADGDKGTWVRNPSS